MGKLMAVAAAVAARLTLIDSATISRKLCNWLMIVHRVMLRSHLGIRARHAAWCNRPRYRGRINDALLPVVGTPYYRPSSQRASCLRSATASPSARRGTSRPERATGRRKAG
jgi:hypothetical protein